MGACLANLDVAVHPFHGKAGSASDEGREGLSGARTGTSVDVSVPIGPGAAALSVVLKPDVDVPPDWNARGALGDPEADKPLIAVHPEILDHSCGDDHVVLDPKDVANDIAGGILLCVEGDRKVGALAAGIEVLTSSGDLVNPLPLRV